MAIKVNRYTQMTAPERFNPMNMQELSMLPAYKRQQEDAARKDMLTMDSSLAMIADSDPYVRDTVDRFDSSLEKGIEELSNKGYNQSTADNLVRLKRMYNNKIQPINTFVGKKAEALKLANQSRARLGSNLLMKDISGVSYDQFSKDPNALTFTPMSSADVTKRSTDVFKNFQRTVTSDPTAIKGINSDYIMSVVKHGFGSPNEAMQFLNNTESGQQIKNQIIESMPALKELGSQEAIDSAIAQGVYSGIGKTETKIQKIGTSSSSKTKKDKGGAYGLGASGFYEAPSMRGSDKFSNLNLNEVSKRAYDLNLPADERNEAMNALNDSYDLITKRMKQPRVSDAFKRLSKVTKDVSGMISSKLRKNLTESLKSGNITNKDIDNISKQMAEYYRNGIAIPTAEQSWIGELFTNDTSKAGDFYSKFKKFTGKNLDKMIDPFTWQGPAVKKMNKDKQQKFKESMIDALSNGVLDKFKDWYNSNDGKEAYKRAGDFIRSQSLLQEKTYAPKYKFENQFKNIADTYVDLANIQNFDPRASFEYGEDDDDVVGFEEGDNKKVADLYSKLKDTHMMYKPASRNSKPMYIIEGVYRDGDKTKTGRIAYKINPANIEKNAKALAIQMKDPNIYYNDMDYKYETAINKTNADIRAISIGDLYGRNLDSMRKHSLTANMTAEQVATINKRFDNFENQLNRLYLHRKPGIDGEYELILLKPGVVKPTKNDIENPEKIAEVNASPFSPSAILDAFLNGNKGMIGISPFASVYQSEAKD